MARIEVGDVSILASPLVMSELFIIDYSEWRECVQRRVLRFESRCDSTHQWYLPDKNHAEIILLKPFHMWESKIVIAPHTVLVHRDISEIFTRNLSSIRILDLMCTTTVFDPVGINREVTGIAKDWCALEPLSEYRLSLNTSRTLRWQCRKCGESVLDMAAREPDSIFTDFVFEPMPTDKPPGLVRAKGSEVIFPTTSFLRICALLGYRKMGAVRAGRIKQGYGKYEV